MDNIEEKKTSLAAIVFQASNIVTQIAEAGGELTPALEEAFDAIGRDLTTKSDSYAFVMDRLEAESEFWKGKADQFAKVARACAAAKERMGGAIKAAMIQLDRDEIEGSDFRFKLSPMKPKMIINQDHLPEEWLMVVTETVADKDRIRAALDGGGTVPGAWLEDVKALRKYPNTKKGK